MKKILILMIASASMLLADANVTTPPTKVEMTDAKVFKKPCKCKMKDMKKCKGVCKCKGMKRAKKGNKKAQKSALLINRGLPPLLRIVMASKKDRLLGLDVEQFTKLRAIKRDMLPKSKKLKKELRATTKYVKMSIASGTTVEAIRDDIIKLASLRANITLLRIECINRTKEVLTKEQLIYLLGKSINRKNNRNANKHNSQRYYKHR